MKKEQEMKEQATSVERDYIVLILGEEFRERSTSRWKAKSEAARDYDKKHPGEYKRSLLVVIARIRQLPEVSMEVK